MTTASEASRPAPAAPGLVQEPAPAGRRVLAQAGFEMRTVLRNGEQLVITLVLPVLLLVVLTRTSFVDLGTPDRIGSLKDLTRKGLKVVLCDASVPCGAAAEKALDASGLELTPVSYEEDVKSALNKVVLKEADAAVVYRTDVRAAGDKVEGVEFPESADAVNDYPITVLERSENTEAAEAFLALVRSPEGRKVLTGAGFLAP